jgi:RNA polymerase sigma-70 factor (ECF subfamily)
MSLTASEILHQAERASHGDKAALNLLFEHYRERLRRMVMVRLDPRLQGRVDASDVIQEAYIEATRRVEEFSGDPSASFYLWLRFLVGQQVLAQHRRHLGTQARAAGREISLCQGAMPAASTAYLAAQLLGKLTSPSNALIRVERKVRLQEALNAMDPIDCEILVLRHYEELSNGEAAGVLGLDKSAASKRYTRALGRLKVILTAGSGDPFEDQA